MNPDTLDALGSFNRIPIGCITTNGYILQSACIKPKVEQKINAASNGGGTGIGICEICQKIRVDNPCKECRDVLQQLLPYVIKDTNTNESIYILYAFGNTLITSSHHPYDRCPSVYKLKVSHIPIQYWRDITNLPTNSLSRCYVCGWALSLTTATNDPTSCSRCVEFFKREYWHMVEKILLTLQLMPRDPMLVVMILLISSLTSDTVLFAPFDVFEDAERRIAGNNRITYKRMPRRDLVPYYTTPIEPSLLSIEAITSLATKHTNDTDSSSDGIYVPTNYDFF
jgi:hypothetical protein